MSNNQKISKIFQIRNVLIIGNGGRENALAWIIEKNDLVRKIYFISGNAGSKK